jgi:hypothetical protein
MARRVRSRSTGRSSAQARAAGALVAIVVAVCACDAKQKDDGDIAECAEYVRRVSACFGDEAGDVARQSYARAPDDVSGRAAQRAQCSKQHGFLRAACY